MIQYKLEFLSEWHIGSGLGAGAESDASILRDKNDMPYIPGKTIKGLLKDAMIDINEVNGSKVTIEDLNKIFGLKTSQQGKAFFSDCKIEENENRAIVVNSLQPYLLKNVASTAINEQGVAHDKSLRSKEVCMPLILTGSIDNVDEYKEIFELAFKWLRGVGINRNRGLGRCKVSIVKTKESI